MAGAEAASLRAAAACGNNAPAAIIASATSNVPARARQGAVRIIISRNCYERAEPLGARGGAR
jgi:hypothetical protein